MADRRNPFWIWFERLGPLVMLLALVAGFAIADYDTFASIRNFKAILVQTAILATCALGMTMIMVSGGLDLSVGSILALSSVSGAATYAAAGSPVLACTMCVLAGFLAGCVNGLFIAGFRMNPFIVTLGMMGIARGFAREFSGDSRLYLHYKASEDADKIVWQPKFLELFPSEEPWASLGLPGGVFLTILLIIIMIAVMRFTVFGRHIYAIGSNEESARLCGIHVGWKKFAIYALAGLIFGIAGVMQMSYVNAGDPTAQTGFELNVIAAVVIGGASLSGGVGTIMGSVIGALIMVVLTNGCAMTGVPAARQLIIIGAIIIASAMLDMFRQGKLKLPWVR